MKRLDETDERTRHYDHEQQEYGHGVLTRQAEEHSARLEAISSRLEEQKTNMDRQREFEETTTHLLQRMVTDMELLQSQVLTKKQKAKFMKLKNQLEDQSTGPSAGTRVEEGQEDREGQQYGSPSQ